MVAKHSTLTGNQRTAFIDTIIERDQTYWANRVVIKVDIPYNEHSYMIGRGGSNTKRVIKSTGCYAHFPDSNRFAEVDKSNIVSITGLFENIETARKAIRELAPLLVTIELPNPPTPTFDFDVAIEWMMQKARETNVTMTRCSDKFSGQQFVTVRTSVAKVEMLRRALCLVREYFGAEEEPLCFTSLEILKPAWNSVLGEMNANIQWISDWTGATIYYPRKETSGTTFFICGQLDNLLSARHCLLGFQPMSLLFNWTEANNNCHVDIVRLRHQLNLSIEIKGEPQSPNNTVCVSGHEYQATDIYMVRSLFFPERETTVVSEDYKAIRQAVNSQKVKGAQLSPTLVSPLYIAIATGGPICADQLAPITLPAGSFYYPATPEEVLPICGWSPLPQSIYADASVEKQTTTNDGDGDDTVASKKITVANTCEYGKRRLKAKMAQRAPITGSPRLVTTVWCGQGFSQSMLDLASTIDDDTDDISTSTCCNSLPASPYHKDLQTASNICQALVTLRLDKYIDNFLHAEYDLKDLMEISEDRLKSIGVNQVGRCRLLAAKSKLKSQRRLFISN